MEVLFESDQHRNVLLDDYGHGLAVQANQHLIIHNGKAMLLDPGGHKAYQSVLAQTLSEVKSNDLDYLFLSHQDPDIVAAVNGWLMTTNAVAYCPKVWVRFVPHFGLDRLVEDRLKPIPDEGMKLNLGGLDLIIMPAHFLHSIGNFQVYDPVSKILYSGDLGASLGADYVVIDDFDSHVQYMEGFHKRYMTCNTAMRLWGRMVRQLDIDIIAPQHGAIFKGKEMVNRFIEWCEQLECGVDLIADVMNIPQ